MKWSIPDGKRPRHSFCIDKILYCLTNLSVYNSFPYHSQAFTDEDGRLQTVHPSMWTTDRNSGSDRPSHGRIRSLDQDYHLKVDEWTDFLPRTVHLMDEFGRQTMIICPRWMEGDEDRPSISWTDSEDGPLKI